MVLTRPCSLSATPHRLNTAARPDCDCKGVDCNKKAPARTRGRDEYLLTTKLFCGYCREMMTGYSGTGKSGKVYHYYACNNFKRRKCKKKVVSKEKIEDRVVLECRKLLTDSNIERIAASVSEACEADRDTVAIKRIKTAIRRIRPSRTSGKHWRQDRRLT